MKSSGLYVIEEGEQEKRKRFLKLFLEKKLVILERVIESNSSCVDLKFVKLQFCTEFWEFVILFREWQKFIFLYFNNIVFWYKYFLFCQSQFSIFLILKIYSFYGKCLSILFVVKDGSILFYFELFGIEEVMFGKEMMIRFVYVGGVIFVFGFR